MKEPPAKGRRDVEREQRLELTRVRARGFGPDGLVAERKAAADKGGTLEVQKQALRLEDADREAAECEACTAARRREGEGALCERHLARALGF